MAVNIKSLSEMDEDELYQQLGIKKRAAELALFEADGGTAATSAMASVESFRFDKAGLGAVSDSLDKLKSIGKAFFSQLSKSAFGVCCGSAEGSNDLKNLIGKGKDAIITAVAALLIAQLGIAAAVAAIVAALIVKLFFDAGGKVLCSEWKKSLPSES